MRGPSEERLIDRAARGAATGMTRRSLVRLGLGAAAAMALPGVGAGWPGAARAQATSGLCPPQRRGSCPPGLTPGRWKPGTATAIPSGAPATFNGCGAEGGFAGIDPVPDTVTAVDFSYGCREHDCCYGVCGADKTACDEAFFQDSLRACREAYDDDDFLRWTQRLSCNKAAQFYRYGVSGSIGQGAYESAQADACFSCEACDADLLTDRENCGTCGVPCAPGQSCCQGVCKDLETDRDNCGTCGNRCKAGTTCARGVCVKNCKRGLTPCGDQCCKAGETCRDGVCRPKAKCPDGWEDCDGICCAAGTCKDGQCGRKCGGSVCSAGADCCFPKIGASPDTGFCCEGRTMCYYNISGFGKCIPL